MPDDHPTPPWPCRCPRRRSSRACRNRRCGGGPCRPGSVPSPLGQRSLSTAELLAESRDDDGRGEEVGTHENGFGGGVVGSCDRGDERQADGDCGDDDEPSALAKESGQHDAHGGTDEGPPRERGDRNGFGVDFETDIGSARDGCHDGGADGRDCARERTASNKTASARLVGPHDRFLVGGVWGGLRSLPTLASLKCVARLSRIGTTAVDHLGEELVLPIRSASVRTRDDADHASAAGRRFDQELSCDRGDRRQVVVTSRAARRSRRATDHRGRHAAGQRSATVLRTRIDGSVCSR